MKINAFNHTRFWFNVQFTQSGPASVILVKQSGYIIYSKIFKQRTELQTTHCLYEINCLNNIVLFFFEGGGERFKYLNVFLLVDFTCTFTHAMHDLSGNTSYVFLSIMGVRNLQITQNFFLLQKTCSMVLCLTARKASDRFNCFPIFEFFFQNRWCNF